MTIIAKQKKSLIVSQVIIHQIKWFANVWTNIDSKIKMKKEPLTEQQRTYLSIFTVPSLQSLSLISQ